MNKSRDVLYSTTVVNNPVLYAGNLLGVDFTCSLLQK